MRSVSFAKTHLSDLLTATHSISLNSGQFRGMQPLRLDLSSSQGGPDLDNALQTTDQQNVTQQDAPPGPQQQQQQQRPRRAGGLTLSLSGGGLHFPLAPGASTVSGGPPPLLPGLTSPGRPGSTSVPISLPTVVREQQLSGAPSALRLQMGGGQAGSVPAPSLGSSAFDATSGSEWRRRGQQGIAFPKFSSEQLRESVRQPAVVAPVRELPRAAATSSFAVVSDAERRAEQEAVRQEQRRSQSASSSSSFFNAPVVDLTASGSGGESSGASLPQQSSSAAKRPWGGTNSGVFGASEDEPLFKRQMTTHSLQQQQEPLFPSAFGTGPLTKSSGSGVFLPQAPGPGSGQFHEQLYRDIQNSTGKCHLGALCLFVVVCSFR
jgi:hypothetical protein